MDGDRRHAAGTAAMRHHSAAAAYGQRRRFESFGANGSARPLSGSRRKDARPPTSYGGGYLGSAGWAEDRPDRPPLSGAGFGCGGSGASHPPHGGLTRQASAPVIGRQASPEASFDHYGRGSPQHHASLEASFARSQALRRASSSSGLHGGHGHGHSHGHGGGGGYGASGNLRGPSGHQASSSGYRAGLSSSAPRRRPYESTPLRGFEQRSADGLGGSFRSSPMHAGAPHAAAPPGRPGTAGGSFQHRSDALQLESRLTRLLQEHSLQSEVASRRGGGGHHPPPYAAAGHHRRPGGYGGKPGSEESFGYGGVPHSNSTTVPADSRYSTPGSHADRRTGASPAGSADLRGRSPASAQGRRGMRLPGGHGIHEPTPPGSELSTYGRRQAAAASGGFGRPPHAGSYDGSHLSVGSLAGAAADGALPESRLKIYSDLFEEVIERDRVFGSLLRKIKTAYDSLLLRVPDMQAVPPMPGSRSACLESSHYADSLSTTQHLHGNNSNEPTTRNEAWEMQRENHVLKDLVERLHLELEEAVRREQRWKQKATKLKTRGGADGNGQDPTDAAMYDDWQHRGHGGAPDDQIAAQKAHHAANRSPPKGMQTAEAGGHAGAHAHQPHMREQHHHGQHGHGDDPRLYQPLQDGDGGSMLMEHPGIAKANDSIQHELEMQAGKDLPPLPAVVGGGPPPRFHLNRREPSMQSEGEQQLLNQGGLLSVSSISAQTSPPPPIDPHAAQGDDSARSTDSGMLPQRPTRKIIVKPPQVTPLDFSRLQQQLEEEDDYDDYADEGVGPEGGAMYDDQEYAQQQQRMFQHGVAPPGAGHGGMDSRGELVDDEDDGLLEDDQLEGEDYDDDLGVAGERHQRLDLGALGDPSDLLDDEC
eukprot:TRINITY_DN10616_c2_g2_i1.p1 TRINITY_DN10616_c2_g2~~TRINITY_DN10616_c2_g2_i1.p1  ORF type:complete len:875 (-),score=209.65 TRINITY_DN10616_c2_g2_i1:104-2728(-)